MVKNFAITCQLALIVAIYIVDSIIIFYITSRSVILIMYSAVGINTTKCIAIQVESG